MVLSNAIQIWSLAKPANIRLIQAFEYNRQRIIICHTMDCGGHELISSEVYDDGDRHFYIQETGREEKENSLVVCK